MTDKDYLNSKIQIQKDLDYLIQWHIQYQKKAFLLSNQAHILGMGGFAHYYQIEAADAFVHTRRIMNYMMKINCVYTVAVDNLKIDYSRFNIIQLLEELVKIKKEALGIINQMVERASNNKDYVTFRFYEWYLIDFTTEIAEQAQNIDYMRLFPNSIFMIDMKVGKAKEPNVEVVKKPFSINKQ